MVELYFSIGMDLISNDWVIMLESDEEPNEELLSDLKEIVLNAKSKIFFVMRIDTGFFKRKVWCIRLFDKNYIVFPTGR